jgi:ribosomal protein L37AE/L43A
METLIGAGVLVAACAGIIIFDRCMRPRCPECQSQSTVCEGDYHEVEFWQCVKCKKRFETDDSTP